MASSPICSRALRVFRPLAPSRRTLATSRSLRAVPKTTEEIRQKMASDLNPVRDEYSKSGGDDFVAEQEITSFTKETITPEGAKDRAAKGNDVNPLDVSPATKEISSVTKETLGTSRPKLKSEMKSAVKARVVKPSDPPPPPKGKHDKAYNKHYKEHYKKEAKNSSKSWKGSD